jgi:hypothetical protein
MFMETARGATMIPDGHKLSERYSIEQDPNIDCANCQGSHNDTDGHGLSERYSIEQDRNIDWLELEQLAL